MNYCGRFAPSPTGALHLGSAATAIFCAAFALRASGRLILRVEDLDTPRVVRGAEEEIAQDLAWLGVAFDESPALGGPAAPYRQSERVELYRAAIASLDARSATYLCDCSRAEIASVASAPHLDDEGPRYPGTCRDKSREGRAWKRPPAVRLRAPSTTLGVDDFVLARADGTVSYHLATTVDDVAMGITEVVRGADLASSAGRQALLAEMLGGRAPRYVHVPLLVEADGGRLAKRARSVALANYRRAGIDGDVVVREIAAAYGHSLDRGDGLRALAERLDPAKLEVATVARDRISLPTLWPDASLD